MCTKKRQTDVNVTMLGTWKLHSQIPMKCCWCEIKKAICCESSEENKSNDWLWLFDFGQLLNVKTEEEEDE